jgi:hypothetical protein
MNKIIRIISFLFLWGCGQKQHTNNEFKIYISKMFLSDTIFYRSVDLKIDLTNNTNTDIILRFKKFNTNYAKSVNINTNAEILSVDSGKGKAEALLNPLYPDEVLAKPQVPTSLLFKYNFQNDSSKRLLTLNDIEKSFMKTKFYFVNGRDSFALNFDKNFSIITREANISDLYQ